ncbi:MAG TPA: fibronectin type III domain-containing protein [Kribbellaceae bacterium]|nr:fibronectin type III domain-containing protein [Kribbellaceae bacterium]
MSRSQIRLTWRDNAGTEDGFRIERCQGLGCTGFSQIAVTGHDATVYTDNGLARNTQYSYRVRAFDGDQVSAYSNTATGKTRHR